MNTQPYETPPQWWPPRMTPWWVRLFGFSRRRELRQQRITQVRLEGLDHLREALARGAGVLITPNHSFHWDSYCLSEAAERVRRPFHFMTAWQVFAMSSWFGRWSLQRHGCFSINREGTDVQAFKQAVEILQRGQYPLVIFPEGDIYHTNDRVTPFRDGAAAIALAAARRAQRPIVCLPTALKAWYVDDPTPNLLQTMERLERSVHWRSKPERPLVERLYRFAEGLLALKELEYLGSPQSGTVPLRTASLVGTILGRLESPNGEATVAATVPERVKEVRRRIIKQLEAPDCPPDLRAKLQVDMDDLFFVIQAYSYPGDYVVWRPTVERVAETLDKFEEDVLHAPYPTPRGERHVVVQFGEPLEIPSEKSRQPSSEELTETLQTRVQSLLDELNASRPQRLVEQPAASIQNPKSKIQN